MPANQFSRRDFLKVTGLLSVGAPTVSLAAGLKGVELPSASPAKDDAKATEGGSLFDVVAHALKDCGVEFATNVPASRCSEIFTSFNEITGRNLPFSYNEEVAYTIAHGSALLGRRSAAVLKSHGLAKAGNSVVDSLTAGTTAGFLVVVTDDPMGRHSDNIFDLDAFLRGTGLPFTKPGPDNMYRTIFEAMTYSEEKRLPVAVYVSSEDFLKSADYASLKPIPSPNQYHRDVLSHVLCPPLAAYQHRMLQAKLAGSTVDDLKKPNLPVVPDGLPERWQPVAREYMPLFSALKELRGDIGFISGDTGVGTFFAFPPFDCIDACTYYGGSLPLALGAHLAGVDSIWAVTGDFAFIAAGHLGLIEAIHRNIPLKLLILHNGCAQTTGGQPIGAGVLEHLLDGYRNRIDHIAAPQNTTSAAKILRKANEEDGMRIVLAEYPQPIMALNENVLDLWSV